MHIDTARGTTMDPRRRADDQGWNSRIRELFYRWQHWIAIAIVASGFVGIRVIWPGQVIAEVKSAVADTVMPRIDSLESWARRDSVTRQMRRIADSARDERVIRLLCFLVQVHERDGTTTRGTAALSNCPTPAR